MDVVLLLLYFNLHHLTLVDELLFLDHCTRILRVSLIGNTV